MRPEKLSWICIVLVVSAASLWAADDEVGGRKAWKKSDGLVAHEWGAMVKDKRNPYDYKAMAEELSGTPAEKSEGYITRQMDAIAVGKPVLFLYTPTRQTVYVTVSAGQGTLTYHYPKAVKVVGGNNAKTPDGLAMGESFEWHGLEVLPVGEQSGVTMAAVDSAHWWSKCRAVPCSEIVSSEKPYAEAGHLGDLGDNPDYKSSAEKFLFYDGKMQAPAAVEHDAKEDGMKVTNKNAFALLDVFVIQREADTVKWGYCDRVDAGATVEVEWGKAADGFAELFDRRQRKAGLYSDEAAAFWAAWETQFYKNEGARVIYRLPQEEMDKVLYLDMQPAPDTLVRVNWVCLGK